MLQSVSLLYYALYDKNKLLYLTKGVIILANIFLDMLQRKGSREISLLSLIWGVLTFSDNKTINDEVFQETTEYEKGFAKYYQENLKPKISELEEERLNALRTAAQKIRSLIIVFISILISFLFVWFILGDLLGIFYIEDFLPFYYEITELADGNSIFYFAIVFLIYVSLLYFFTLPTLRSVRNLKSSSKSEIFSVILKYFGDFTFTAKPNISVSQFESTGLIPKYKREENEDYVIGDYEGVKVELFESILSLNPAVKDLGEVPFLEESLNSTNDLFEVNNLYTEKVVLINSQKKIFTDKNLFNFLYCQVICNFFPNARVIHCIRNPLDNILSIYRTNFLNQSFSSSLNDITELYLYHLKLMNEYKNKFGSMIYSYHHDKVVQNPEETIKNLLNWLEFFNNLIRIFVLML